MNLSSRSNRLSKLNKAPLAIGLALVLGAGLSGPVVVDAAVAPPAGAATALRLGDQRAALERQLSLRRGSAPGVPERPAGIVTVGNCDDSGPGSLRDALLNAVSGDVVDLTALDCSTITLGSGLTVGVDDLTIHGPGADRLALDGDNGSRVLAHTGYGMLTIDGLTIRNGAYTYSGPGIYAGLAPGACILSTGSATISGSAIEHCSASGWSVFGGAVDVLGALHLTDSSVSGTTATAVATEISATIYGGAIYAGAAYITGSTISDAEVSATSTRAFSGTMGGGIQGFAGVVLDHSRVSGVTVHVVAAKDAYAKGGGVASPKTVVLISSTVSGNSVHGTPGVGASGPYGYIYTSAIGGGGVYIASIPRKGSYPSYVLDSTISGNSAICDGDVGQYTVGGGGGLGSWARTPVTITNSTISGNSASTQGGGLYARHTGSFALANSTITDNSAPVAAGIADNGDESPYDLVSNSSIVAGNHLPAGSSSTEIVTLHDITGANNLVASANAPLPGDTLVGDPLLAPLADNGGPTRTHALLPGSPAIDAGNNLAGLASDQRGDGHARVLGDSADIGAYESEPASDRIFSNGFD